jgi:hypothetical protein
MSRRIGGVSLDGTTVPANKRRSLDTPLNNVLGTFSGKETLGSGIYKMTNKRKNRTLVDHLKGFAS